MSLGRASFQVFVEPGGGARANGQEPVFLALAFADHHRAAFQVEVIKAQAGQFLAPHSRRVKDFEDGPVPNAYRRGQVRLAQNLFGLMRREHLPGQTFFHFGQLQVGGGIGGDVILSAEPFEKALDGRQTDVLPGKAQGRAVLFAMMKEHALITLQHRARHVLGV